MLRIFSVLRYLPLLTNYMAETILIIVNEEPQFSEWLPWPEV